MRKWPTWFPLPNAWLSALFLLFLLSGFTNLFRLTYKLLSSIAHEILQIIFQVLAAVFFTTKLIYVLALVPVIIPVVIISTSHHVLQFALDTFFPEATGVRPRRFFFPSVLSWWEGLYGWLTLNLTTLTSFAILGLFSVKFPTQFSDSFWLLNWTWPAFIVSTLVWVTVAAYFYQFEYVIRQYLMNAGRSS